HHPRAAAAAAAGILARKRDHRGVTRMFILGLTGSIGMGKSTTAKFFADEGVPVHDADAAVHALYEEEAAPLIEAALPGTTSNGKVNREKLAKLVLGRPEAIA